MRWLRDEIIASGAIIVLTFVGLAIWNHDKFDPQQYGVGAGLVLAAIGGGQSLRSLVGGKDVRSTDPQSESH